MEINFGNLPMIRDSIPSMDHLCAWADGDESNLPPYVVGIIKQKPRSDLHKVVSAFTYNGADAQYAQHARSKLYNQSIKVYHKTGRGDHKRVMLAVPSTCTGTWQSSWRVYSIDPSNRKFVNVGPANGAVFDSHTIHTNHNKYSTLPSRCTNIRADENGQLPHLLSGHRTTVNRMYPDKNVHIQLQFDKWLELLNPDGTCQLTTSRHSTRVGIWSMTSSSFPLLLTTDWRDQMGEDLQLDFTRDGFPMSDFDLAAALLI